MMKKCFGFSLVEVLLALSVFLLIVTAVVGAIVYGQESVLFSGTRVRAAFLAEEGLEAARNMRDNGFGNLSVGVHGVSSASGEWAFFGASDVVNEYTRVVEVVSIDPRIKEVTSTVSWDRYLQPAGSVSLVSYFTNWQIPQGDWSYPSDDPDATVLLPGGNDGDKIQVQGDYAYVVSKGQAKDFVVIDISGTPFVAGQLNLASILNNLVVSGDYAYIASSQNNKELLVIDISDPANPSKISTHNVPGTGDAEGIDLVGDVIYLVGKQSSQKEFVTVDVSDPGNPNTLGELELGETGEEVVVLGNYAYVASHHNSQELQVVDVSDVENPFLAASYDLPGDADGRSITGFGSLVVFGRHNGEMFLFDVSDPLNPYKYENSMSLGDHLHDVDVGMGNEFAFFATGEDSEEFQVIDISNPATPFLYSGVDLPVDLNGVAYDSIGNRVFAVGQADQDGNGFFIIIPD